MSDSKANSIYASLFAGTISGTITRLIVAPLDVVKIRFQIQMDPHLIGKVGHYIPPKYHYMGILHAFKSIYLQEGMKGLWRGNLVAEMMWASFSGGTKNQKMFLDSCIDTSVHLIFSFSTVRVLHSVHEYFVRFTSESSL
eukprot:TRINITY_DN5070_c0_g1_i3.p2 TRINITY_DN5070_c0_g1~~TRINITY_DN5070_c0_g1_i3.p2  ORF type:complete len:140 (-),score=10.98 TRINITY_DN5070_c0_g1_i3:358-777(-)